MLGAGRSRLRSSGSERLFAQIAGLGWGLAAVAQFIETGDIDYPSKCNVECRSRSAQAFQSIVKSLIQR